MLALAATAWATPTALTQEPRSRATFPKLSATRATPAAPVASEWPPCRRTSISPRGARCRQPRLLAARERPWWPLQRAAPADDAKKCNVHLLEAPRARNVHLASLYLALFCLISVKAVTTQALPGVLAATLSQPERVAEALGAWTAIGAALEFASLPALGALSDSLGRRPMMLALAALTLVLRLAVVAAPCAAAVIASRVVVSSLVNGFLVLVAASVSDLCAAARNSARNSRNSARAIRRAIL